jgi:hypothetical protein
LHCADGLSLDIESLQGVALDEIPDLIAFLDALSGELPKIAPPELPWVGNVTQFPTGGIARNSCV